MMHIVAVMPCLNEEELLEGTCASLGFGETSVARPNDATLVLVDNGSDDGTWDVIGRIQQASPAGSVVAAHEPVRGYVPPRHRGTLIAREIAHDRGLAEDRVLIVQLDADTEYSGQYLSLMRESAVRCSGHFMVEAMQGWPADFAEEHPRLVALCNASDASVSKFCVDEADDVIIGDARSAYLLSHYFAWGGHRREFLANGDEAFAETSRLLIQARLRHGARKVGCTDAQAFPSRRKNVADAALSFATAGFPRERSWQDSWQELYEGPKTLAEFEAVPQSQLALPIYYRRAHTIVLLGLLPSIIAEAASGVTTDVAKELPLALLRIARAQEFTTPADLIFRVLGAIDSKDEEVASFFRAACAEPALGY